MTAKQLDEVLRVNESADEILEGGKFDEIGEWDEEDGYKVEKPEHQDD